MLKNLIKDMFIIPILLIFMISSAFSDTLFNPPDSDVSIADENVKMEAGSVDNSVKVYSAPQCGAFFLIRFFQIFISPQDGPSCRFDPTCSNYGRNAVSRYGSLLGSILAGERLIRCNPSTPPGKDPVPEKIFK
jgi:hypothetical protein